MSNPECIWTEETLAQKLGVIQKTVNSWISDIRACQWAGRNIIVIRLNRLGWILEKIAKMVGLDRSVVSKIVQNTKIGDMHNLLSQSRDRSPAHRSVYGYIADLRAVSN